MSANQTIITLRITGSRSHTRTTRDLHEPMQTYKFSNPMLKTHSNHSVQTSRTSYSVEKWVDNTKHANQTQHSDHIQWEHFTQTNPSCPHPDRPNTTMFRNIRIVFENDQRTERSGHIRSHYQTEIDQLVDENAYSEHTCIGRYTGSNWSSIIGLCQIVVWRLREAGDFTWDSGMWICACGLATDCQISSTN